MCTTRDNVQGGTNYKVQSLKKERKTTILIYEKCTVYVTSNKHFSVHIEYLLEVQLSDGQAVDQFV